jgi:hypothetical protein
MSFSACWNETLNMAHKSPRFRAKFSSALEMLLEHPRYTRQTGPAKIWIMELELENTIIGSVSKNE